jgi:hypothetical protein
MPAIRDYAQNYTSTTSAMGFVCSAPALAENDLLVAIVSADAGSQLWFIGEQVTYAYRDVAGTPTNYTTESNNETTGDVQIMTTGTPAVNHAFYVGSSTPFNCAGFLISTAGAGTWTFAWEYYDSTGTWTALPGLTDGTTNFTGTAIQRTVQFTVPGDWATTALQSQTLYWIRARIATYSAVTTRPLCTRVFVGKWPRLFSTTNTVNHGICYKYASASEPADYRVIYTVADTANAAIVSIRDVDLKAPFATTLPAAHTYSETNADSYQALDNTTTAVSQSFAGTAGLLCSCAFYLKKNGTPTGTAVAKLYAHSGVYGTSSVPTGRCLAISDTFDVSTLTTTAGLVEFKFTYPYTLTATNWCIVLEYTAGTAANYVQVGYDASAAGHGGNKATYASAAWTASATEDVCFYCYNFTYTTGTATAAKSNMPTMTTSRNNSLVLWVAANAGTSTTTLYNTSILEGPCTYLFAKDGTGHSDACSWGFLATAGTTSASVGQSNLGTGTQTITTSVCAVQPPSTGTTVIPVYCSADASTYVTPLTGAAYNSDSAPANTVTSVFGATLNGVVLAAGGTTVTRADTGINSYHAMVNCAATTTANQWGGLRMTIATANKPNVTGKNLLFHFQPYLPLDIQTTDMVGLTGACGVAIGLSSVANTDYKVWHVGGAGTPWGIARHVPVVINESYAGVGRIANAGTLNAASIAELGFMVSGKVVVANWLFGSCWLLDTTTVVGGYVTEPMKIDGIVRAAADGKERRSVIQQGSAQFMIFGPIQVGDGSLSTYLELDATALEFPQQYSKADKVMNYCAPDNVCGLKYYAAANDTIIHKNSIISSKSRYFWGLHASSNTGATYDFSGLTINDYLTLDMTGLSLVSSTILKPPAASAQTTITTASSFHSCSFNVSTVAAGNHWANVANPSVFDSCIFTGGGGHAMRLTAPGTFAMTGNTFSAEFGADGSTGAAILNDSGGLVTINITDGTTPTVKNVGAATTTINNLVAITVTPLENGSEVRAYLTGTSTEVDGEESSAGGSVVLSLPAGTAVDIVALCYSPPMVPVRRENVSFAASQNFDPVQRPDANFNNAA